MCFFLFKSANPSVPWSEAAGAMARATTRLEDDLDTTTTGSVGVLVRPIGEQSATQAKAEVERATTEVDRTRHQFEITTDNEGHAWVIVRAGNLPALASGAAAVGEALAGAGLADRVMAAVYPFHWTDGEERRHTIYWIYQPRLKSYTPFVPDDDPEGKGRDHQLELRVEQAIRRTLPTNHDIRQWYPIWGMPF